MWSAAAERSGDAALARLARHHMMLGRGLRSQSGVAARPPSPGYGGRVRLALPTHSKWLRRVVFACQAIALILPNVSALVARAWRS